MGMAEPAVLCGINQETANESLKMINEAELIEESAGKLLAQLDELIKDGIIGSSSAILFFNDSSTDATEERLIPHMGFPSDIVYFDVSVCSSYDCLQHLYVYWRRKYFWIYTETKRRPRYVIESAILPEDSKKQKGAGQKDIQRK